MTLPSPLFFLTLLPIIGALFVMVFGSARFVSRLFSSALLVLTIILFVRYDHSAGGYQFASSFDLSPSMGLALSFGADGLSLAMLMLAAIVTFAAVWVVPENVDRPSLYYSCILLISAGVIGAFASLDILFFYAFHELALIPTFLLIGIWGSGDRQAAAWKATIYLGVGSFVLLLGIIGLYLAMPDGARTFDLVEVQSMAASGLLQVPDWVFVLLLFGFGTLVSLVPFHTWAPRAYACAPTPAAMLHAGVLKKFGLYGLIRLVVPIFPETIRTGGFDLGWLGLESIRVAYLDLFLFLLGANILYVGLVTIAQKRLDWMLGYSSVMHMGYIFLGIAALNELSLSGAAFLMVAHGLSIAALFALCGLLQERTGTLDFAELGGLGRTMPKLGLLFGFAAMASVGLPGFANFPGELLVFFGAFGSGADLSKGLNATQITTIVAVWGVVISAVYMLRAYRKTFFGTMPQRWEKLTDVAAVPRYTVAGLIVAMMIIGFYPQLLLNFVTPSLMP